MSDLQPELNDGGSPPITGNLFLIRLWDEVAEKSNKEWHGRVLHVTTGKAYSFQDWPELVRLLTSAISKHIQPENDNSIE